MEKLDKKDLRMLYELDYNSRIRLSGLARKCGLSVQLAKYRLGNLFGKGVIKGTLPTVDLHRLGYFTYRVYMRLHKMTDWEERKVINYFVHNWNSMWVVSMSGRWDMEVLFATKNPVQVNMFVRDMKNQIGKYVKNYTFSPSMANFHFERSHLVGEPRRETISSFYGLAPKEEKLDAEDVKILDLLSQNARMSTQEIAQRLNLGFNTVKGRIARMEKRKVIQAYRTFLDLEKVGRLYFKALITAKNFDEETEKRMLSFCVNETAVTYLIECFGEWDLEIEAEVKDEEEIRGIMRRFVNEFSEFIDDYELVHVYREHKMNYFPVAAEMLKNL